MNSNVKLNSTSIVLKARAAILISCAISVIGSPLAQAQSNYQLIEQEIERAEGALKTTEKFIEQLLWREVPQNQSDTKDTTVKTSEAVTELSALAAQIETTQANLVRARDQLDRSNRILAVSQQELLQAKRGIENLDKQKQVSLNILATITNRVQQLEQETLRVSALIEDPGPELDRLKVILATAQQQSAQRNLQAQQLQQTEAQFQQELEGKRNQLNTQNSEVQSLRKQIQGLQEKMTSRQDNWAKVGQQIDTRNQQRQELEAQLDASKQQIARVEQEREILKTEIDKAAAATSERRSQLSTAKSNLSNAKKNLKSSEQELRRAQNDLDSDEDLAGKEVAIQQQVLRETQEANELTRQLKRNDTDMKLEISQLEKLLEVKNQALVPLKQKTAQLKQQKQDALNKQNAQRQQANNTSARLVSVEQRYQAVSSELRSLTETQIQ